jgi:hypothetical protein
VLVTGNADESGRILVKRPPRRHGQRRSGGGRDRGLGRRRGREGTVMTSSTPSPCRGRCCRRPAARAAKMSSALSSCQARTESPTRRSRDGDRHDGVCHCQERGREHRCSPGVLAGPWSLVDRHRAIPSPVDEDRDQGCADQRRGAQSRRPEPGQARLDGIRWWIGP